jgi:hypothetical protein
VECCEFCPQFGHTKLDCRGKLTVSPLLFVLADLSIDSLLELSYKRLALPIPCQ